MNSLPLNVPEEV